MAKKYYEEKRIKIPIYNQYLSLVITNKKDISGRETYAHTYYDEGREQQLDSVLYLYINPFYKKQNITQGVIAHEAVHVVNRLFHHLGIYTEELNDEHQAYLVGWVVDEMNKFLKELKLNKKIKYEF